MWKSLLLGACLLALSFCITSHATCSLQFGGRSHEINLIFTNDEGNHLVQVQYAASGSGQTRYVPVLDGDVVLAEISYEKKEARIQVKQGADHPAFSVVIKGRRGHITIDGRRHRIKGDWEC